MVRPPPPLYGNIHATTSTDAFMNDVPPTPHTPQTPRTPNLPLSPGRWETTPLSSPYRDDPSNASQYSLLAAKEGWPPSPTVPSTPGTPSTFPRGSRGSYGGTPLVAFQVYDAPAKGGKKTLFGKPLWAVLGLILGGIVIVAVAVGVGVSLAVSNSRHYATSAATQTSGGAVGPNANKTGDALKTLPRWDWTSTDQKVIGVGLGSWLVVERWLNEDWFVQQAGPDAWDEWSFSQILGQDKAKQVLAEHWDTWVTEDMFDTFKQYGINTVRIPTGFWAWIPTAPGEPYVAQAGQLDRVERALSWAHDRGMYVLIDLHGMPGNQDGDQLTGHNTSQIEFFTPENQVRADAMLRAAIDWVEKSPYRSAISGLAICNEPRPTSNINFAVLRAYYDRAWAAITNMSDPVPMLFHHGYPHDGAPQADRLAYWLDWVQGKDPHLLVMEDHPYPGMFPPQTDMGSITGQVCSNSQHYEGYPIPIAITEWSVASGIAYNLGWDAQFYAQQLQSYSWSGGSTFWSHKSTNSSNPVLAAAPYIMFGYSFLDLVAAGVIPKATSLTVGKSGYQSYMNALPAQNACGPNPGEGWANITTSPTTTTVGAVQSAAAAPLSVWPSLSTTPWAPGTKSGVTWPRRTAGAGVGPRRKKHH